MGVSIWLWGYNRAHCHGKTNRATCERVEWVNELICSMRMLPLLNRLAKTRQQRLVWNIWVVKRSKSTLLERAREDSSSLRGAFLIRKKYLSDTSQKTQLCYDVIRKVVNCKVHDTNEKRGIFLMKLTNQLENFAQFFLCRNGARKVCVVINNIPVVEFTKWEEKIKPTPSRKSTHRAVLSRWSFQFLCFVAATFGRADQWSTYCFHPLGSCIYK